MKRSFIFFMWACRLRRRSPAPSPRPEAVCSQSCKKSFLRSLFCSSGTSASVLAGFPPATSREGNGKMKFHFVSLEYIIELPQLAYFNLSSLLVLSSLLAFFL